MTLQTIKTIENKAGDRRVVFYRIRDTGMIRYDVDKFFDSASEDEGVEIGWLNVSISGLLPTLRMRKKML